MNKSQRLKHFTEAEWTKIKTLADTKETPFLVVHLDTVQAKFQELREGFPKARIYYAVKANPAPEVLNLLAGLGCCFDIASRYELDLVMSLGVPAERISYGNTIKKAVDIRYAYEKGVRTYASDSEMDVRRIAREAPGSHLHVRMLTEGTETADWPLSRKFGCQQEMVVDLVVLAKELGLDPAGISFHVGSQQRDLGAWDAAIAKVKFIFDKLETHDIKLRQINMGGGFPAAYVNRTHEISHYCKEITHFLKEDFGDDMPEIMLEPGRSMVGESGVIVSEVVLISRKSRYGLHRWVYTDIGVFGGLIETLGESIRYPIYTERQGKPEEAVIAGPTCDSMDILYEDNKVPLPMSLEPGDRLYWMSTGAYTTSYSSIAFNGFPPLKAYFV